MPLNTFYKKLTAALSNLAFKVVVFFLLAWLLCCLLASVHISTLNMLMFFLVWLLISPFAYRIRQHRLNIRPRPRNTRGAERAPLLPHFMEGQE
jgi:hypothetical protein